MPLENGEKILLARIDERLGNLAADFTSFRGHCVTLDMCALRQREHDAASHFQRAESIAKTAALLSVATAILWAVLKHA